MNEVPNIYKLELQSMELKLRRFMTMPFFTDEMKASLSESADHIGFVVKPITNPFQSNNSK